VTRPGDSFGCTRTGPSRAGVALGIALASALLLSAAPGAFALGTSPAPAPSKPAQSAPAAAPPAQPVGTPAPLAKPADAPATAQPVAGAIATPDIPLEADRLLTVLRGLEERVAPTSAVFAIEAFLPEMAQRISDAQLETKGQLAATSSLTVLTNLADLWSGMQGELKAWADRLRVRATDVGTVIDQLEELAATWTRTREEARRTQAPPALIKRVDETLAAIATVRKTAAARRTTLLTLQVKVGEQLAAVQDASARVGQATAADFSTLLRPDRPPIWRAWREAPPLSDLPAMVRDSASPQLAVLARFLADRARAVALQVVLFLILVAFALAARRQARAWAAPGTIDTMLRVFDFPVSTALIVTLLLSNWVYARQPMIAVNAIALVLLVPIVRILRRITAPGPTGVIWLATAFFVLNRVRDFALLNAPVVEQAVVLLVGAGGAAAILWLRRRQGLVLGSYKVPEPLAWLLAGTLAASFLFGAFGYMRLARLLNGGVLRSAYTALALYVGWIVALGVFAYLLRVRPLARLHMVTRYRSLFERRAAALLWWAAAVLWLRTTFQWFSLLDDAESLLLAVLNYQVTRGFVTISLGDVLALVATIWAAFLVSRFLRFALEEDIYPRLPMGRGVPYSISSLLHYMILLLGFTVAIGALGVDLNRMTLLTGAFGVGVGFGLQTIVNNFVSGLILLVERPIQVGDAIQMADLDGEVRRIGIRSTTVHTWQGAEVIVPNATLISGNLINWTLADRTRRLDLPLGVPFGSDPQRVLALLIEAAASVPGVLGKPAPVAFFQGFGDSALNFELRAWTDHFEEWVSIRSQMTVAVNNRLKAEGIEIPFPQRDVMLHYPPRAKEP
jgi:potassium-dependent mechanosensitive channel